MKLCDDAQDLAEWLADNQRGDYDKSKRRFPDAKVLFSNVTFTEKLR